MKIKTKAYINLFFVVFFWGITFPIQKLILNDSISPVFYNGVRFSISIIILLIFKNYFKLNKLNKELWKKGLILGAFLSGGYLFQTWGLFYTSASKSGFITALYVGIVAILSPVLEKKIPKKTQIISLLISITGLIFVTNPSLDFNVGDLLTLFCSFFYAFHIIYISIATKTISENEEKALLLPQFIAVAVVNFLIIPLAPGKILLDYKVLSVAIFASIFPTIYAVSSQLKYQKHLGSVGSSLAYVGEPAFALFSAMIILNEIPTKMETFGLIVMAFGMLLGTLSTPLEVEIRENN
ncbi:MAG: hypothetical protein PWQ77_57 [Kosmotogales bacterium]|nr:hypothetical protein [Kosmotogales bacterium]